MVFDEIRQRRSERSPVMQVTHAEAVQMKVVSVLVVDAFNAWRDFVTTSLGTQLNIHILGAASTGPEAVQKTLELRPDLVLLEIGLPELNGIEAARQIVRHVPETKILFLSSNSDPEVVREAFAVGGHGYVFKLDAATELVTGVESVRRGKKFLSSSFADIRHLF